MRTFETLFHPQSIAIIGASSHRGNVGNDVLKNIVESGFQGEIFPINPKVKELYGKKVYSDIGEVTSPIDLAIIIIPAKMVNDVLKQCGEKNISSVIVISAGFREAGNAFLEREIIQTAKKYHIELLGPNCLGIINPHISLNASFAPITPQKGNVAFLSQSGALCASILDWAQEENIGFSKFISTGNKAVIDEYALLEYLMRDEHTDVIALYIEDLQNAREMMEFLRKIVKKKPIIVLKSGKTDEGLQASASHTGALAGSDDVYNAVFRQSGIIRVSDTQELFLAIKTFSLYAHYIPEGKNVAVITNAGGPGVLLTDDIAQRGLRLAVFSEETRNAFSEGLPSASNISNPVDVLGDALADRYALALEKTLADSFVHMNIVLLTPQTMTEVEKTAQSVVEAFKMNSKPIVAIFMGGDLVTPGIEILQKQGVLVARHPHEGSFMLSLLYQWKEICHRHKYTSYIHEDVQEEGRKRVREIIENARLKKITGLPEAYALPLFEGFGFKTLISHLAKNAQEAKHYAQEIEGSVVLKIVSSDILHKTDVGGIRVGVSWENVETEYEEMMVRVLKNAPGARIDGVMIVQMAPQEGVQMVVGAKRDPVLGSMVMVGLGGIYVEILKDVSFGVTPFGYEDALFMIRSLRTFPLLDGVRGGQKLDTDALIQSILLVGMIMEEVPEIQELDINPLLVLPQGEGTIAMDGRISLSFS